MLKLNTKAVLIEGLILGALGLFILGLIFQPAITVLCLLACIALLLLGLLYEAIVCFLEGS